MCPVLQALPHPQPLMSLVPPLFEVGAATEGDTSVIRLTGEFDLSQCPRFERALLESESSDAGKIVLDLEGLTFIDAAGLHALLAASRRSAGDGDRLRMTPARGEVAELLRLTALDLSLPMVGNG